MKRSEMIKILARFLPIPSYNKPNSPDIIWAERALNLLENSGMQPPAVPAKLIREKDYRWGGGCTMRCNCEECNPEFPVNRWEKE